MNGEPECGPFEGTFKLRRTVREWFITCNSTPFLNVRCIGLPVATYIRALYWITQRKALPFEAIVVISGGLPTGMRGYGLVLALDYPSHLRGHHR